MNQLANMQNMQFNPYMMGNFMQQMNPMMMGGFMMPNMPGMQSMPQMPEMAASAGMPQPEMQQMPGAPTDSMFVQSHDEMHMGLPKEIEALE